VRWYELLPGTLTVRQLGTISDPANYVFNAAISPASNGRDAAIHYNIGGPAQLVEIRAQSRDGGTPLGQMRTEVTLATSAAPDQDFSCSPCRWGDYAGASPDPANGSLVWGSNQLIGSPVVGTPAWQTRNFALVPNTAPVAAVTGPRSVQTGRRATFSAAGSTDDGSIVDFKWDLDGNGSFETDTGPSPTVSRTYSVARAVAVRVRAVDDGGLTGDAQAPLRVIDRRPPRLRLQFKRVQDLATVLRRGVRGSVTSNEAARAAFQLVMAGGTARSLHITRTVTVGEKKLTLKARKRTRVTLRLSRRARARLRSAQRVRVTLKVRARDASGNVRRASMKLLLER
jgi:hypothetical protein